MSAAISAATNRASACSSSVSTTWTSSPSPSSDQRFFSFRSRLCEMTAFAAREDRVRRAVVLLERDHTGGGEVALELEDVPDVGSTKRVDTLVWVADCHQVPVFGGEKLQQHVLRVVRVLVLVDEDVAKRPGPPLVRLGEALQDVDREHQQVVEVDGVRREQPALVELVDVGDGLVVEARDTRRVLVGRDELVLRLRDLCVDAAGDEALRVAVELLEARLHEPHLVGLVVDREVRAVAEPFRLAAQDRARTRHGTS